MKEISPSFPEHEKRAYVRIWVLVHPIQEAIIKLSDDKKLENMTLREIGEIVGAKNSPQKVKHHLNQLVKMGVFDYIAGKYVRHKIV